MGIITWSFIPSYTMTLKVFYLDVALRKKQVRFSMTMSHMSLALGPVVASWCVAWCSSLIHSDTSLLPGWVYMDLLRRVPPMLDYKLSKCYSKFQITCCKSHCWFIRFNSFHLALPLVESWFLGLKPLIEFKTTGKGNRPNRWVSSLNRI